MPTSNRRELLIGCGSRRTKLLYLDEAGPAWSNLTTLDLFDRHEPDVVWDLECLPLPFPDDQFDEIHAYEVLEHTGRQGDWRFFFAQFSEFWRILRPGGFLAGTSPAMGSPWLWGDPGHTRVISPECFLFLDQTQYTQVGRSPMSDYRSVYSADFEPVMLEPRGDAFGFLLRAHKPSRAVPS